MKDLYTLYNATRHETDGHYIDFYNGTVFMGSINTQWVRYEAFYIGWWLSQLIWITTLKTSAIYAHSWDEVERWTCLEIWVEKRIAKKYGEQ